MKRVAIIGAGLQCQRRAGALVKNKDVQLVVITSLHLEHAQIAATQFGCKASDNWEREVTRDDVDIVFVCTPPHVHAEMSIKAMECSRFPESH